MTTTRQTRPATTATVALRGINAEWTMAMLVLLTIAMSILSSATGHADVEGKAKNGVRRAASSPTEICSAKSFNNSSPTHSY